MEGPLIEPEYSRWNISTKLLSFLTEIRSYELQYETWNQDKQTLISVDNGKSNNSVCTDTSY
jgi:hypothetical protein